MKNIRRYIHKAGTLLLGCALLSSCIAEDLSDCGKRLQLKVSFMFEPETDTRTADTETHRVALYAFDGKATASWCMNLTLQDSTA